MAENSITFTIKAKKDGSWRIVAKDAESAASAIDNTSEATKRATKAQDRWSKGNKGVAQAGMNSTKAFSKMNQTMVGSSGLVGAYATLAANVFALTAAFGVLQRAAATEQLSQGLEHTGLIAGRNLPYIADQLKEITGEAVSTAEAMSTIAMATASGFSGDQIKRLGEVAKGASLALGRDMGDALSRLIRGSAKLEPELLDELGIMVRLDDAARDYAAQLGTTADQLTQYQKRQAFVNAVIEQGESAFSNIASKVDPNPYDQLAAALKDLLKEALTLINVALIPMVKFFSTSKAGLIGGVLLFASSIRKSLLPGLMSAAKSTADFAEKQKDLAIETQKGIITTGKLPKVYKQLHNEIQNGTASYDKMVLAQQSLKDQGKALTANMIAEGEATGTTSAAYLAKAGAVEVNEEAQKALNLTMAQTLALSRATNESNMVAAASQLKLGAAWKFLTLAVADYRLQLGIATTQSLFSAGIFKGLKVSVYALALGFKALGVAILTALPYLAIFSGAVAAAMWAWNKFFGETETEKQVSEITESLDHLTQSYIEIKSAIDALDIEKEGYNWKKFSLEVTQAAGAAQQIRGRLNDMIEAQTTTQAEALQKKLEKLADTKRKFEEDGSVKKAGALQFITDAEDVAAVQKEVDDLQATLGKFDTASYIKILEASRIASKAGGAGEEELARITGLIERVKELGPEATAKQLQEIWAATSPAETQVGLIESAKAGIKTFSEEIGKLGAKTATPFDTMLGGLNEIDKALNQRDKDTGLFTEDADTVREKINDVTTPLGKAMKDLKKDGEKPLDTFTRIRSTVDTTVTRLQEIPGEIKKEQAELAKLKNLRKEMGFFAEKALEHEENIRVKRLEEVDQQIKVLGVLGLTKEQEAELLELKSKRRALVAAEKSEAEETFIIAQASAKWEKTKLDVMQKMLNAQKKINKAKEDEMRREALQKAGQGRRRRTSLTPKEEKAIQKKMEKDSLAAMKMEYDIAVARTTIEFALLREKFKFLKAEAKGNKERQNEIQHLINSLDLAEGATLKGLKDEYESKRDARTDYTALDVGALDAMRSAAQTGDSVAERLFNAFSDEKNVFDKMGIIEKIQTIQDAFEPMKEDLAMMGPDGEFASAVMGAMQQMIDGFALGMDVMDKTLAQFNERMESNVKTIGEAYSKMSDREKFQTWAAGIGIVAAAYAALMGVISAKYQHSIRLIDKEIEAEKKRDGQSQKSLNILKGLEEKKERMRKKEFAAKKKMMIAQAIMATALGIAVTLGQSGWLGIFLASIVGAMGAAQVAIISGMSYEGGGGSVPNPGAASASVGERRGTVDLAKSQSAAGELAYLRGQQGIGGPENFRGAFTGYRHRAAGGTAGYVVGEQGPELFIPEQPGTIVPADDTENMVSGGNNVTFNIHAIDAAGVQDVLVEQQGNIIGMIRSAANEYGNEFLEEVDTSIYSTPFAAGYRRA